MSEVSARLAAALADRYRLERELGQGGMATVHLAQDLKHDRKVAVKVLRPELGLALGAERFLREIATTANLRHPHILPLYDSGEAAGFLYYVMPLVEGESLRDRLDRQKQLPIEEALTISREVADALGYAHQRGIIHRDIKPENILLEGGHAVVADFGIARAVSSAGSERLTETGLSVGTPLYMSPEQAAGDANLDGRSDLYSLGCVLYEMLGGQAPFTGPTAESITRQHLIIEAAPITNLRPSVPPAVTGALVCALAKNPADRFATAADFMATLQPLATPGGGVTPPPAPPIHTTRAGAAPRRRPALAAAAAISLVAAAGFATAYLRKGGSTAPDRLTLSLEHPLWMAVLPPQFSGKAEDDWFADGLADEIRSALVRIPGVQVKASRSSQSFKGTTLTIAAIAKALGVDYVVVSTVRWSPTSPGVGRVNFAPELVDARTEAVRWKVPYDTTVTDLASGQRAIAEHVARDLASAFSAVPATAIAPTGAAANVKPEAYAAYLAGKQQFFAFAPSSRTRSLELLGRAVALDSTFAKAHAWLAIAIQFYGGDSLARRRAVRRAVALAPDDPDVLAAAADDRLRAWDWTGARTDLSRALAADPNHLWALYDAMLLEGAFGNLERSVELGKLAATLDPVSAGDAYAVVLFNARRMDEALAAARAGLALDSLSVANSWHEHVAEVLAWRGDVAGTRAELERQAALTGPEDSVELSFWEAGALAQGGRPKEARAHLDPLRTAVLHGWRGEYRLAGVFASLGEADSAFAWLDRGLAHRRSPLGSSGIPNNPYLASLHSDPRYLALLRRLGFRP